MGRAIDKIRDMLGSQGSRQTSIENPFPKFHLQPFLSIFLPARMLRQAQEAELGQQASQNDLVWKYLPLKSCWNKEGGLVKVANLVSQEMQGWTREDHEIQAHHQIYCHKAYSN